jgi:FlaA1/EpsC-like NDP-sugar epimerase
MNMLHKTFRKYISNRYLPRWVVFAGDAFIIASSFLLSYLLRFNFVTADFSTDSQSVQFIVSMIAYMGATVIFRPYAGVIRHTTSHDIARILYTVLTGAVMLAIYTQVVRFMAMPRVWILPWSILLLHMMIAGTLMVFSRMAVKYVYLTMQKAGSAKIPVMIYGAGDLGQTTLLAMERSINPSYSPVGFVDTNRKLQGKQKSGLAIYSPVAAMQKVMPSKGVKEVVLAISPERMAPIDKDKFFEYCIANHIEVRKVPPVNEWIGGTFTLRQVRRLDIADLLGRKEIQLDMENIQAGLEGKSILVTGAAGSIGSELVRQLMAFRTGKIILHDQAESALYDLQMELQRKYNGSRDYEVVITDVSNPSRIEAVFRKYRPAIVFNAAAYKHVPLLEDHVFEAVRVNIGGTKLLADLAVKYDVEKFVMISTDKAVNPTSVMGATKRVCELYVQALGQSNGYRTKFVTTRFGNVLGSTGSVVPLFSRQIEAGGPVTVTHRDVKRYFMTIPEACQLVLEAGFLGTGGEIFVFDMGEPVKIYDLAVKMISLAGFEPDKEIKIIETGLRPGEKLFEEILLDDEKHVPTNNPKLLIARLQPVDPAGVMEQVDDIFACIRGECGDSEECIVGKIRKLVPEFKPANARFQDKRQK